MEFEKFQKIPRYKRNIVITEKLDGTNAQVAIQMAAPWEGDLVTSPKSLATIVHDGTLYNVFAGSRNRWLTVGDDNYGFAKWVYEHAHELVVGLGEGRHYGEWWGQGIQRRYGLDHKRFSLFNTGRWDGFCGKDANKLPECCHVVPLLYSGPHYGEVIEETLAEMRKYGSTAVTGFMDPEGIVVYHTAGRNLYKVTLDGDAAKGD